MGLSVSKIYEISIHTLHAEGDRLSPENQPKHRDFNPHPPCGGRPENISDDLKAENISIHTLHAEGDVDSDYSVDGSSMISIHTLHAEGDDLKYYRCYNHLKISIHTLHAEGDLCPRPIHSVLTIFQSTPSMRRATCSTVISLLPFIFQSTPSMRRATAEQTAEAEQTAISIHTLHAEGDLCGYPCERFIMHFNPHPPCGGRQAHREKKS